MDIEPVTGVVGCDTVYLEKDFVTLLVSVKLI